METVFLFSYCSSGILVIMRESQSVPVTPSWLEAEAILLKCFLSTKVIVLNLFNLYFISELWFSLIINETNIITA